MRRLSRQFYVIGFIGLLIVGVLNGCKSANKIGACTTKDCGGQKQLAEATNRIEYADVERSVESDPFETAPPLTSATELPTENWQMTLDEAISVAFSNTEILRDLNARVLENPEFAPGVYDPAIQATDPNFGIDAALADFDTQFTGGINYQKNDDVFNNAVIGGGANEIQQDLTVANFGLQKVAATGTQFALRGNVQHDANNRPGNLFDQSWSTLMEAEIRQPLLQGRGLRFNRIAGPGGQPGLRSGNGVLISRINNDISIAQFERDVNRFVDQIIDAYWDLYFAYRNFEAIKAARDSAQNTWNTVRARYESDLPGGEADKEAQAREQFFVFQGRLIEALNGNRQSGTPGVLQAEADLRRLLNLPQSDGVLIRPDDKPLVVDIRFDWYQLAEHAINERVELREQEWRLKRRELELFAARNFTKPRLDAVALYRNNGFGDDLLGGGGNSRFSNAFDVANDGNYQDWELGLQMAVPIGFRQASAGVRNAELQLMRERRVLEEQQRQILHGLGAAVRRTDETFALVQVAHSRLRAAQDTVESRQAAFEADAAPFDELLDAQQRLADAEVAFHRETINWSTAVKAVSRESGQLLASHAIYFNEAQSCNPTSIDLMKRRAKIARAQAMDYRSTCPIVVDRSRNSN